MSTNRTESREGSEGDPAEAPDEAATTTPDLTTEAPEVTEATETNEVTEATETNEVTEAPEAPEAPEVTEAPETNEVTEAPETTEVTEATEVKDPAEPGADGKGKSRTRFKNHLTELPILIGLAFVIAVLIKTFFVQAFYIPSGSMFPTLHVGDRVLVEKVSDLWTGARKGDIVVFERDVFGPEPASHPWYRDAQNFFKDLLGLPTGSSEDYIKRVVAVGGDSLRYIGNPRQLIVNGEEVDEPFINRGIDRGSPTLRKQDCKRLRMEVTGDSCRVPAGMVFVMGDNRSNSEDSRIIGPIDESKVVGKAFMILWPFGSMGTL